MFTNEEARNFVEHVVKVWDQGLTDEIENIYTQDVVGHSNEQEFNFEDIQNRIRSLNEYSSKRLFSLFGKEIVIGDLLVFQMRQVWLRPADQGLCESHVLVVYRIRNGKVGELWLQSDEEIQDYTLENSNLADYLDKFSVAAKDKSAFLQQMTDALHFMEKHAVKLSSIEIECLFYYFNGYSAKEVARVMGISHRTVEGYLSNIKSKFNCSTRRELRLTLFPNSDV